VLLSVSLVLAYVGLIVYSGIDCLQTPAEELNRHSRTWWIAFILVIPVVGAIGWLLNGQSGRGRHERAPDGLNQTVGLSQTLGYGWTVEATTQSPIGPDDDPEFLASRGRAQLERKRLLTRLEEDRRRREEQRRQGRDQDDLD
jgi:hypothetical protein